MHAQGISHEQSHLSLAPQPGRYTNRGEAQGAAPVGDLYAQYQDHFNRLHAADLRVEELKQEMVEASGDSWPVELFAALVEKLAYAEADRDRLAGRGHE